MAYANYSMAWSATMKRIVNLGFARMVFVAKMHVIQFAILAALEVPRVNARL